MATVMLRRHGDIMIKTFEGFKIPKEVKLAPVKSLFKGQHHEHFIASGKATHGEKDGKRYLRVVKPVVVDHDEHGKGDIPVGDYYVEQKLEYDHFLEESRQVID